MPNAPRPTGGRTTAPPRRTLTGARLTRTRREIWVRDACACRQCGKFLLLEDMRLDHVVPLAARGTDHENNLQTLCVPCHNVKTARQGK